MTGNKKSAVLLLAAALCACGGGQKPAESPPPKAAGPLVPERAEPAPDLSPVAAPSGLFAVGRLRTPLAVADRLLALLGVPGSLMDQAPARVQKLARAIDTNAPVEFAAMLDGGKKSDPVAAVVSIGLRSFAEAVEHARNEGARIEKLAPGVMAIELHDGPRCVVAVALGSAPARLVCAEKKRELELLSAFATRGLPTIDLGKRELEVMLDVPPIVELYKAELDGARLLSGFLIRQIELDAPRFDRAMADAVNAVIDDLVLLSRDVNKVRLGGEVSEERGEIALSLDFELREQKSLVAGVLGDFSKRSGPPPASFFTLPGDAQTGGYSHGFDAERFAGVRRTLAELADAFLEHEKVGKVGRERARDIIDFYFELARSNVTASGERSGAGAAAEEDGSFSLAVFDSAPKALMDGLADVHALAGDRDVRRLLAKRLGVAEKLLPKAHFVPLRAASVPAGSRALVLTIPDEFMSSLRDKLGAGGRSLGSIPKTLSMAVVPHGSGAVFAHARTPGELAGVLGAYLGGTGPTLADRSDLAPMRNLRASTGFFVTLSGLVSAIARGIGKKPRSSGPAASPPLFVRFEGTQGPPVVARIGLTIPKAFLQAAPARVPELVRP
jgi:hypothetical protein